MVKAQVREDGIAYYGVARSLVINHNLQFQGDWRNADLPSMEIRDPFGRLTAVHISKTGHLPVHSAIGTSLLWMPFIAATHAVVLALNALGAHISADGFSEPYLVTIAAATCLYAFLGLWMSFCLAKQYAEEGWAFLATVALWLGSSLPAYIYVDPAWSHAHSVFVVALFLWYWNRTRERRSAAQWFVLGLISGLMVEVYFPNVVLLLVVVSELAATWFGKAHAGMQIGRAIRDYVLYATAALIAFLPTFAIRTVLFGSPLAAGAYGNQPWNWTSPAFLQILFSASQGLLSTTPVILPAIVGLFLFARRDAVFGRGLIAAFLALWALMAVYPLWNLGPSFGNRYFISLIPAFIIGLAVLLSECARAWGSAKAFARRAWAIAALLIIWNLGLLFQWSTGLMPDVGHVYWSEILYNQFRVVPGEALHAFYSRFSFHADNQEAAREADTPKS